MAGAREREGAGGKQPPKFLKSLIVFTRNPDAANRLAETEGFCFLLHDQDPEKRIDFESEAEGLATYLRFIFPRETLASLKKHLPDF